MNTGDLIPLWEPSEVSVAGRCGRLRPQIDPSRDPRYLHLRDFVLSPSYRGLISAPLPVPPSSSDRTGKIPANGWGVLGNDRWGNCVLAGEAHFWMATSATDDGQAITVNEADVVNLYRRLSPGDRGLIIGDVLTLEQQQGLLGQKIIGFVSVDPDRRDLIKLAVHEFGGAKLGVNLPASAQAQFSRGLPWTVTGPSPNIGGHDIEAVGYDADWLHCVTWGRLVKVAWNWVDRYTEEAFARITPLWLGRDGVTPTGLDITALLDALGQMGDGPKPTPPPAPPVPPINPPAPTPPTVLTIDPAAKTVSLPPGWTLKS